MSGYSFSAHSKIVKVTGLLTSKPIACTPSVGQVVDTSALHSCILGSTFESNWIIYTVTDTQFGTYAQYRYSKNSTHKWGNWFNFVDSSCPSGSINPDTGVCEDSPEPEPSFCQSPPVEQMRNDAVAECSVKGGHYSEQCIDKEGAQSFKTSCDDLPLTCDSTDPLWPDCKGIPPEPEPEPDPDPQPCNELSPDWPQCNEPPEPPECVPSQDNNWCDNPPCKIGFAGWPECEPWYDDDPTAPLDPLEPPTPDPIDPVPPRPVDPVNPQPPLQPGDPFNDSRVVGAIQNLNKDMNFGFSDINGALQLQTNVLSSTNELVYQGLLQDLKIHDNQIANDNKNTGNIMGGLGGIGESINGLGDAIGNIPTPVPYDDTGVIDAINKLGEKLDGGQACEPTSENNYCENNHGLDSEYISTMFSQLSDKMDTELSASSSSILSSVNDAVTSPPVDESTVKPFLDLGISLLTANDNCVPMDWFGYELSCEFSDRFKLIFGFALYMYTLSFLIDVLLTQVTPRKHDK